MKKRLFSAILAGITAASLLAGCGSTSGTSEGTSEASAAAAAESGDTAGSSAEEAASGGTVIMARGSDSESLDPVMTASNVDIWILNMVVEGLVGSSDDGTEIIPAVADTWEVSDDGLTYTFHIRDGIQFSTGDPVTAEDVVYSLTRAKEAEGPWAGMLDMMDSIEDGGDGTVIAHLNAASPAFLPTIAMFYCGIMPKAYCEEQGEEGLAEKPVGTGPFVLDSWSRGEKMVFKKNTNYWESGSPKVDEIDLNVVADDSTRIMQLESGQIDIAADVPYSRVSELQAASGVEVSFFDSTDVKFVLINCQGEETKDKRVRQALALATDKKAINDAVYYGNGTLAETYLAPALPYSDQDIPAAGVDVEKAKELLTEAGYPDGFSISVQVGNGDSEVLQTATLLQQQWKEIGITLDIQQIDKATARQNWKDGNYDVFISNMTSDMTDISELAGLVAIESQTHCWRTYWNDEDQKKAEEYCTEGNSEMDETKRAEAYKNMQEVIADAVPLIPILYAPYTFVTTDKVQGAAQNPLGVYNFRNMTISK